MLRKAVFLDRDGVINRTHIRDGKPRAPKHVEEFEFLPEVHDGVSKLKSAGYLIVVVTNQPDVVRGWQKKEVVEAMNSLVFEQLGTDAIKVCYHDDHHGCVCRKPLPGMLVEAAEEFGIELAHSFMVGDRQGDIEAGKAAGCRGTIYMSEHRPDGFSPDLFTSSFRQAAEWILENTEREHEL